MLKRVIINALLKAKGSPINYQFFYVEVDLVEILTDIDFNKA